jgi:hypothetical protein
VTDPSDSRAAASNPPFRTCLLSDFDHTWRLLAGFGKAAPGQQTEADGSGNVSLTVRI